MSTVAETRNRFRLIERILALSDSQDWDTAKHEWDLIDIYLEPEGTCLCGHHPITEQCVRDV
jgi:hypothetical protein